MNEIEMMLVGRIQLSKFVILMKSQHELQKKIRELIPTDAKTSRNHVFWQKISYDALKEHKFDLYKYICKTCLLNGTIGDNLNIFGIIRRAYCFHYPNIECTNYYDAAFDLYLDVAGECFDGPEVHFLVEQIVYSSLSITSKVKRKAFALQEIRMCFHVTGKHTPRWIQGAEWPMGINSPMEFISEDHRNESIVYTFRDVDTDRVIVVEQMY